MSADSDDRKRRPLPRWRYAALAVMTGEHGVESAKSPRSVPKHELDLAAAEFRRSQSPASALDLLNVAAFHQADPLKNEAANYLKQASVRLPQAVKDLVGINDLAVHTANLSDSAFPGGAHASESGKRIRYCRRRLLEEPRNVVLILDLARAYTVQGKSKAAERLVRIALNTAPNHRLVTRRAARWMVHANRAEEAWDLVRRNPRTRSDPWLMATEISLAEILNRPPQTIRAARNLLAESGLSPADTTELASAVGTLDFNAGQTRRGRKFLRASLVNPTDNSIAQAQWLQKYDAGIEVDAKFLSQPSASEARFLSANQQFKWLDALRAAVEWQDDEPFSSRPAIAGSFLATNFSLDPSESPRIAKIGLQADPSDQLLRNNLVVGLVMAGPARYVEAQREFQKLRMGDDKLPKHVYLATHGLVRFTTGDPEGGRRFYQEAIAEAPAADRLRVSLHWFNAESMFSPEGGEVLRRQLGSRWREDRSPINVALRERFEASHEARLINRKEAPKDTARAVFDSRTGEILLKL